MATGESEALSLHHPKMFLSMYKDGKFKHNGLKGRRLGSGCYRFIRRDKKSMYSSLVFIEVEKPWASERTMVAVLACAKHGLSCPVVGDEVDKLFEGEPCKKQFVLVEASRWMPRIARNNGKSIDVEILRYPKARTVAGSRRGKATLHDVDFFIQLVSRD